MDSLPPESRGPLHGLPISLKVGHEHSFRCIQKKNFPSTTLIFQEHIFLDGQDATVGIARNIDVPCPRDAELVRVLKELGAVPFCRTNLPQTCASFDCCNPIYGQTRNPRNLERGPGGSSGGESALIAGGGSVLGFGTKCSLRER